MPSDKQVAEAIKALPRRLRTVFVMRHVQRKPLAEIAAELHLSDRCVDHQLSKALRQCRERLSGGKA